MVDKNGSLKMVLFFKMDEKNYNVHSLAIDGVSNRVQLLCSGATDDTAESQRK